MIVVTPLDTNNTALVDEVATLLQHGFAGISEAWHEFAVAQADVQACSQSPHISLVALHDNAVVGWIAAEPQYAGNAWELHPLVVAPHARRQGVGRLLVTRLRDELRVLGACTLFVWCDDEVGSTSLSLTSLYPEPLLHASNFQSAPPHAGAFYQKLGFVVCGVLPDANGNGKPDILFAQRV